jgi:alpha-galactosidase
MGWNAWYAYFREVDEFAMKEAADQMVELGLRDVGYQYVNLDDSWMAAERDPVTHSLVPNATKFPSGFKALATYMHDRKLKMGLYSSAGTMTCVSLPGSLNHEVEDAQAFASWGIDFLKYDDCYGDSNSDVVRYTRMRNALNATGRPMLFSLCNGGQNGVWAWAPSVGNMWRSTSDILRTWVTIEPNFWNNQQFIERMPFGKFTHSWPDPDMLQIGIDQFGQLLPLSEQRSQFGLWVLAKAPLILSTNLTILAPESLEIIKNKRLIDIHQNPHYPPARCYVGCRVGDKVAIKNGTWSSYSILATSNVLDDARTTSVTVAIVMNWSGNQTMANFTMFIHDIGIVPMPNMKLVVTDLWTGQVVKTTRVGTIKVCHDVVSSTTTTTSGGVRGTMQKSTTTMLHDPIPIGIPALGPHDNVIYQFETSVVTAEDGDCDAESSSSSSSTFVAIA